MLRYDLIGRYLELEMEMRYGWSIEGKLHSQHRDAFCRVVSSVQGLWVFLLQVYRVYGFFITPLGIV